MHVILAGRLRGVLLLVDDRIRTNVVKVLLGDSVIVHIEHVKLLFLRDNIILLILLLLLCRPLVGVPVICFLSLGRQMMCHRRKLIGAASIHFSSLGDSCVTFKLR